MKIQPKQIISIWNAVSRLLPVYDKPDEFQSWMNRFIMYAKAEVELWNKATIEQRQKIGELIVELNVPHIEAKKFPKDLPIEAYDVFEPVIKGKLQKPEPALKALLEQAEELNEKE